MHQQNIIIILSRTFSCYNAFIIKQEEEWTHQYGEASQEVIDEDNTTDQVGDLQRRLKRFWSIDGWPAFSLSILHHYGGNIKLVLVSVVTCLNREGLKESDADADHTHGHTATD